MEITKFQKGDVLYHIRHDLRELPNEKSYGNQAINPDLTKNNFFLVDHGKTAKEIRKYQRDLMKEIHAYNRKNVVYACELVLQCPSDCPPEKEREFFQAAYDYFVSTLPMGERCVLSAIVHTDEKHYTPTGEMISKDHMHLLYVPAVPDTKHEGYEYKLCARDLTSHKVFYNLHPGMQKYLDDHGVKGTVYQKKEGKNIALSVAQLKELTEKTGIKLDHSLTVEELGEIIRSNVLKEKQIARAEQQLHEKEEELAAVSHEREMLQQRVADLEAEAVKKDQELEHERSRSEELEEKLSRRSEEREWGSDLNSWGSDGSWDKTHEYEEEF